MLMIEMKPLPFRILLLIVGAVFVLAVPLGIGVSYRLGASDLSLLGIIALVGWLPLLFLALVEGQLPHRRTFVSADGDLETQIWRRRVSVIPKNRITRILHIDPAGLPYQMLFVEFRVSRQLPPRLILIQRDPFVRQGPAQHDSVKQEGKSLSQALGVRFESANQLDYRHRFLTILKQSSSTTWALFALYCLFIVVGSIWSAYCLFMLAAVLFASPIVVGVQLAESWKEHGKTKLRFLTALVCMGVGGAGFLWATSRGRTGEWELIEHGQTIGSVVVFASLAVFLFGLSVMMGNAGMTRD